MIEPYKGIARIYDEIRPSYPEELILDIIRNTKLTLDSSLLEIGAGTGKATMHFVTKGYKVHAIEIGEEMAALLRDKCAGYPDIAIDVAAFEEWEYHKNHKMDMIYSAQAFHWINKSIKYEKCYHLLADKGYLVLFWYKPTSYKFKATVEVNNLVNNVVTKYAKGISALESQRLAHNASSNNDERRKEIEESGLFHIIGEFEYTHKVRNDSKQYLMAMKSVPAYAAILDKLDTNIIVNLDKEIEDIIIHAGGYVDEEFQYTLYIAQKL